MTLNEFMALEECDGIIVDDTVGTITSITNYVKGEAIKSIRGMMTKALHNMREIEVSFTNEYTGCIQKLYFVIYPDFEEEVHNRSVLDRLRVWNPFDELVKGGAND